MLPAQRAAAPCGCSYQEVDGTSTFDILPLNEARANNATGQRVALLQEYMGYIQRVGRDKRGSWSPERARRPRHSGAGLPRRRKHWGRSCRSAALPTPSTSGRQTVGDAAAPQGVGRVAARRVSLTRPRACSRVGSSCYCLTSFLHAGWAIAMKNCGTRGR